MQKEAARTGAVPAHFSEDDRSSDICAARASAAACRCGCDEQVALEEENVYAHDDAARPYPRAQTLSCQTENIQQRRLRVCAGAPVWLGTRQQRGLAQCTMPLLGLIPLVNREQCWAQAGSPILAAFQKNPWNLQQGGRTKCTESGLSREERTGCSIKPRADYARYAMHFIYVSLVVQPVCHAHWFTGSPLLLHCSDSVPLHNRGSLLGTLYAPCLAAGCNPGASPCLLREHLGELDLDIGAGADDQEHHGEEGLEVKERRLHAHAAQPTP